MFIRAISALLGVVLLYGTWYCFATPGLMTLCSLVTLIACIEYSAMVETSNKVIQSLFVFVAFAFHLIFSFYSQSFLVFLSFFIFLSSYFILFNHDSIEARVGKLTSWTVGVLYCGVFTGAVLLGIRQFAGHYFLALALVSFATDTFAYFGGRAFGKKPLAPQISPKKTVEGSFFGLIGGTTASVFYINTLQHNSPAIILVVFCAGASLFSQVGDLFESMVKRYSGVKDSGKILPGHGGILDRIDGLLFAAPIIYLWMSLYLQTA